MGFVEDNNETYRSRELTAKRKYNVHKQGAKRRNVGFLLTFDEWWNIWQQSGHWEERGNKKGCYCMSRYGDIGPYAIGNVFIQTCSQNVADSLNTEINRKKRYEASKGTRVGEKNTFFGKKHTQETKDKMSESHRIQHLKKKQGIIKE